MSNGDRAPAAPASYEPLSFEEGVTALEGLLDTPAEPATGKETIQAEQPQSEPEDIADEAIEPDDDGEPQTVDEEAADDTDESSAEDEAEDEAEESGATELADDTEFDLGDGQRATLKDLKDAHKRVRGMQQSWTKNTQELADQRREVEEQSSRILEHAQQIAQWRESVMAYAQHYLPQPPLPPETDPNEDPISWINFQKAERDYNQQLAHFQHIQQQAEAEQAQTRQQQERAMQEHIARQREILLERRPELRDATVANRVRNEMMEFFPKEYGADPKLVAQIADPVYVQVMLDAMEYRKLKAKAPAAKAVVASKPKMMRPLSPGKRANPDAQAAAGKKAKVDRLRKTGSLEAAVDALMDYDL